MNLKKENTCIFYEGKIRNLNEAFPLLLRRYIEEDFPLHPDFPEGADPYRELSIRLGKQERSIKAWTYDWNTETGRRPTLNDLCHIISIVRSTRILEIFNQLLMEGTPKEHLHTHLSLVQNISDSLRDLANKLDTISEKK